MLFHIMYLYMWVRVVRRQRMGCLMELGEHSQEHRDLMEHTIYIKTLSNSWNNLIKYKPVFDSWRAKKFSLSMEFQNE